jgi:hypothetical protein
MHLTESTQPTQPGDSQPVSSIPPAQPAWQVTFVTPKPRAMPSERMQARAELVRSALNSGGY